MPLLKARRGTIIRASDVRAVAPVWHPRPATFLDMMTSPDYATGNVEHENETERARALATRMDYSKPATPTD